MRTTANDSTSSKKKKKVSSPSTVTSTRKKRSESAVGGVKNARNPGSLKMKQNLKNNQKRRSADDKTAKKRTKKNEGTTQKRPTSSNAQSCAKGPEVTNERTYADDQTVKLPPGKNKKKKKEGNYGKLNVGNQNNNEGPYGKIESPYGKVESPYGKVESPYGKIESPYGKIESPYGKVESPYGKIDTKVTKKNRAGPVVASSAAAVAAHAHDVGGENDSDAARHPSFPKSDTVLQKERKKRIQMAEKTVERSKEETGSGKIKTDETQKSATPEEENPTDTVYKKSHHIEGISDDMTDMNKPKKNQRLRLPVATTFPMPLTVSQKEARVRACICWFDGVLQMKLRGIREEFIKIVRPYIPSNMSVEAANRNHDLNRYEDVFCLDTSRVVIRDNPEGDYIHASYVNVSPELVYICAQGPLSITVAQFWLMIMQEDSRVVLQLCQFLEDGKEKCNEYYPQDGFEWKSYDFVQVRVLERMTNVSGMKKVTKSIMQVKMDGKDKIHEITHLFFWGWPDHSVAESVQTCREIRSLIHRIYEKKPIVAHCSAGIGRTGTFVLIELACHRLLTKFDAEFKMYEIAKELRDQRMSAIQNDQQYVFAFRCVLDILLAEDALPKTQEILKWIDDYEALIQRKKTDKKERHKNKRKIP